MFHLMVSIDWYGPYSDIDHIKNIKPDFSEGLYLAIGKCSYERQKSLQYVGISQNPAARTSYKHHKLNRITADKEIWLGEVSSVGKPGPKSRVKTTTIDLAEYALAYFLKLPLNEKKTKSKPRSEITVLNRWWRDDYVTPRKKRPHCDWPDIIDFRGKEYPARIGWSKWTSG